MFKRLYISLIQFFESCRTNGLVATFREIVYINRELILLEKGLSSLEPIIKSLSELNMKFIEISKYNFNEFHLKYPFKNRYLKTVNNINNGYRAFVIMRDNEVLGDMWYATSPNSEQPSGHHDLKWLEVDLGEKGVYSWDLYVVKRERKNSTAMYLLSLALHSLQEKGYSKMLGFHWIGNNPAFFLYRIFRFKELKRMKASRFLFFKKIREMESKVING